MTERARRPRVELRDEGRPPATEEKPTRSLRRPLLIVAGVFAVALIAAGWRMMSWRASYHRLESAGVYVTHAPRSGLSGVLLDQFGAAPGWLDRVDAVDFQD